MATKKAKKVLEGDTVTLNFVNGKDVAVDMKSLNEEMVHRLALHGLSQKLGDSYAGADDADEAFECASRVAKDLAEGKWASRVASGGPRATQFAEALSRVTGETLEVCISTIEDMDDDRVAELKTHPMIKSALAAIKAEKAATAAEKAAKALENSDATPLSL